MFSDLIRLLNLTFHKIWIVSFDDHLYKMVQRHLWKDIFQNIMLRLKHSFTQMEDKVYTYFWAN
jgi:hypothetical protein